MELNPVIFQLTRLNMVYSILIQWQAQQEVVLEEEEAVGDLMQEGVTDLGVLINQCYPLLTIFQKLEIGKIKTLCS